MRFNLKERSDEPRSRDIGRAMLPEVLLAAPISSTADADPNTQQVDTNLSSILPMNSQSTPAGIARGRISAVCFRESPSDVLQVRQRSTSRNKHPNNIMNANHFNGSTMFAYTSGVAISGGIFNNVSYNGFTNVIIVDAVGRELPFPLGIQPNQKSVRKYLELLFQFPAEERDKKISGMLLEFVQEGKYSLSIDEGRQVVMLGSEEEQWASVVPGTKIVMSVILEQENRHYLVGYQCPLCQTWNSNQQQHLNMAEDCVNPECFGRFQAIEEESQHNRNSRNTKRQNKSINRSILRNLHILQTPDTFLRRREKRLRRRRLEVLRELLEELEEEKKKEELRQEEELQELRKVRKVWELQKEKLENPQDPLVWDNPRLQCFWEDLQDERVQIILQPSSQWNSA